VGCLDVILRKLDASPSLGPDAGTEGGREGRREEEDISLSLKLQDSISLTPPPSLPPSLLSRLYRCLPLWQLRPAQGVLLRPILR